MKRNSRIRMDPRHRRIARNILQRNLAEVGEGITRAEIAVAVGGKITQREHNWLKDHR